LDSEEIVTFLLNRLEPMNASKAMEVTVDGIVILSHIEMNQLKFS
jgi:hypothetical protein